MHNATKRRWGHEVDVIIIGTGAAGMSAAIVTKNEGLEPLLLEKTEGRVAPSTICCVIPNWKWSRSTIRTTIPNRPVARWGVPMRRLDSMVASLARILRTCVHHRGHSRRSAA